MEKGSDITLNVNELVRIRQRVEERYKEVHPDEPLQKTWKTNANNYTLLSGMIEQVLKKMADDDLPKKVSPRFLAKALFISLSSGKIATFRSSNIDALYVFAWGKKRQDLIQSEASLSNLKKHSLYFARDIQPDNQDQDEVDNRKAQRIAYSLAKHLGQSSENFFYEVKSRDAVSIKSFIDKSADQTDEVVHLYIDEAFLTHKQAMEDLIEIFSNLQKSIFDSNISLHFDNKLFKSDGFLTTLGYKRLAKFWNERLEYWEELAKDGGKGSNTEMQEYLLITKGLMVIFLALRGVYFQEPAPFKTTQEVNNENFCLFLQAIKKTQEKPLSNIYEDAISLQTGQKFLFLCTIAYNRFLNAVERSIHDELDRGYMLSYFHDFNELLIKSEHRVLRIFSIPAEFKRKRWQSTLTYNENLNLFAYCLMNATTTGYSLLLLYDESKEQREVLARLDYVIRIPIPPDQSATIDPIDIWSKKFKPDPEYKDARLYLAFPKVIDGTPQMIEIEDVNDIKRYYVDFRARTSFLEEHNNPVFKCVKCDEQGIQDNLAFFNLTPGEDIQRVIAQVRSYRS